MGVTSRVFQTTQERDFLAAANEPHTAHMLLSYSSIMAFCGAQFPGDAQRSIIRILSYLKLMQLKNAAVKVFFRHYGID